MSWLKSEPQFRKFERFIRDALCNPDNEGVEVTIPGNTPATTAVQLRGAIRSLRECQWPCNWTPRRPLDSLMVRETYTKTFLITKPSYETTDQTTIPITPPTPVVPNEVSLTSEELRAFAFLISAKKLKGPITFKHETLTSQELEELELLYDVAITSITQGTYRLI